MRSSMLLTAAVTALLLGAGLGGCTPGRPAGAAHQAMLYPSEKDFTQADAEKMVKVAEGQLAPVYTPLADYLVTQYELADKSGIGIDLGSGPGTLIVELAKRTKLHWVNADINPHFFAGFYRKAEDAKVGHRVSAVFADAHALPFRSGYADIIVSRGTFEFWQDKVRAFGEVHRVLKPGGVAFIGRGFSPNLPVEVARKVRGGGSGGPPYDPDKTEAELSQIMSVLRITKYRILRPHPVGSEGLSYGIWIEWRK